MKKVAALSLLLVLLVSLCSMAFAGDEYPGARDVSVTTPARSVLAITPHDTNQLTYTCRAVYVGTAGDIKMTLVGTGTETFKNAVAGTVLPVRPIVVFSTGTTASTLLCLW